MRTQKVTLAIPKEVLRRVKLIAVQQGTSVSGLLTQVLEGIVSREEGYELARERYLACLDRGMDLGTGGAIPWKRKDLHGRK